jgi:uncharacterized OsmC-like protein
MTNSNAMKQTHDMATQNLTNGVDVGQIMNVIGAIEDDPGYAKFQFRATNQWIDGGLNRSRIKEFCAGNAEDTTRAQAFMLDADEAPIIAGQDSAPNPVEYVLHALAGCLTTSLVYHASVRGIEIEAVESSYTGDIDIRGLLGLAEGVRKGYNKVTVNMRVKSEASAEDLTELALYSPVYDMLSRSLPVEFELAKY